jgi:hypothetical protein
LTIPLPITSPSTTTSTASPASKRPSTPVIPTGSRLLPCSRSTRAAPPSTITRPCAGFAYRSQSLKLGARFLWAANWVPTRSPATAARRFPGRVPSAITASIPDEDAIPAAATLLRIPPRP